MIFSLSRITSSYPNKDPNREYVSVVVIPCYIITYLVIITVKSIDSELSG
jgi:hypothetical protein